MKRALHRTIILVTALILCCMISPRTAYAESAVDTLTIKVGYTGMDLTRYVKAGSWNWAQLYHELPMDSRAYSYFQSPAASDHPDSDAISSKEYNAIVDSANGFYITDLLEYAGLYTNDIYNIGFYVTDHSRIWTSFDISSLFENRYYFNDLPSHRRETDDGYDFSDAWNDCELVEPMLAIEDNWASYTQDFESIGPDFTDVKPGNRFHLMFGQTSPTQQLTKESAKYINCLYVTLKGKPEFTTDDIKLETKIGSHTATMRTRVDNEALIKKMAELLELQSTNEAVLKIQNVRIERDENYSDLATVVIDYDIVGKGKAQIVGNFGGSSDYSFDTEVVEGGTDKKGGSGDSADKGGSKKSDKSDKSSSKKQSKKQNKKQNKKQTNKQSGTQPSSGGQSGSSGGGSGSTSRTGSTSGLNRFNQNRPNQARSSQTRTDQVRKNNNVRSSSSGVFKLSDDLRDQLKGLSEEQKVEIPAKEDTTKLEIKDDRKETKRSEHVRALAAAFACAGIMGAGAVWEEISFRLKLKRKAVKVKRRSAA